MGWRRRSSLFGSDEFYWNHRTNWDETSRSLFLFYFLFSESLTNVHSGDDLFRSFNMVLIGWIFLPPCDVEAHSAASTLAQCCPHVVKLVNCMCRWNMMKTVFNQIFYIFKLTRTSIYQYITLIVTFSRNSSPKILKSGEVSSSTNHFWSFSVEQSCN